MYIYIYIYMYLSVDRLRGHAPGLPSRMALAPRTLRRPRQKERHRQRMRIWYVMAY